MKNYYEWTKVVIEDYTYGKEKRIDKYEPLRLELRDIRQAGIDEEQEIWKEIKEVQARADNAHQKRDFVKRDALNKKAKNLKMEVASLALFNEDKMFTVFNRKKNQF